MEISRLLRVMVLPVPGKVQVCCFPDLSSAPEISLLGICGRRDVVLTTGCKPLRRGGHGMNAIVKRTKCVHSPVMHWVSSRMHNHPRFGPLTETEYK